MPTPQNFEMRCTPAAGNLLLTYTVNEDKAAVEKGFPFLGVARDSNGSEVHLFEMQPRVLGTSTDRLLDLLNAAAHALESPGDFTPDELHDLISDLGQTLAAVEAATDPDR